MKTSLRYLAMLLALVMIFAVMPLSTSAKSISEMKIVAFGDSLTHYGNSSTNTNDEYGNLIYNNAYPEYLQKLLGATVYNAGVGGNTTDMAIHRMQNEVINQNADVVVICLGMNDQAYAVGAKSVLVPIERYRANLETFVKVFEGAGIDVVFATPNPVCDEPGYYKDGPEYTYNNGQLPLYCNAMREVAVKYGCGLVDINYEFDCLPAKGPYMGYGDGIHQNDKGRQFYAELVAEYVNATYGTASKSTMTIRCVDKNNRVIKEYTVSGATGAAITVPSPELYGYTAVTSDIKTTFVNGAVHSFTYDCDLEKLIATAESINEEDYAESVVAMLDSEIATAKSLLNTTVLDFDAIKNSIIKINNLLATAESGELVLSLGASYESSEFTYSNPIYADDGVRLTDGAKGAPSGASSLYAAWQSDATVTIDLGEKVNADIFRGYFACTSGWGVKNPTGMTAYYLSDSGSWVKINGKLEIKRLVDEQSNIDGTWSVDRITITSATPVTTNKIKFEIPRNGGFIWVDEMEVALNVGEPVDIQPENGNLALYKPYTAEGIYTSNGTALYPDENGDSLTDGIIADTQAGYDNYAFVGFNSLTDYYKTNGYASVTVDLGKTQSLGTFVARVSSENASNTGAGVAVISKAEFYVSSNGINWTKVGEATPALGETDTNATLALDTAVSGRYIQYRFTSNKSWMMISEVEAYSEVKGDIPVIPDPEVMKGDVNGNGEIDSIDYAMLKRAYFGIYNVEANVGDINGNEEIDSIDYSMLKRVYFGIYQIQ
ncbi:MAG: hypothetical protein E7586_00575 [Ruminococcaceae bacterium]|nr:hypothetical protein [Oscillospiraceae bacterium]